MTIARRLELLERSTSDESSLTIFVPWSAYPNDDGDCEGLVTADEKARLVAALDAEGLRVSFVFWQWSVEATLAAVRRDRDDVRRSRGRLGKGRG